MRSRWLNYNHCIRLIPVTITTLGLFLSVAVHTYRITSCELDECSNEKRYINCTNIEAKFKADDDRMDSKNNKTKFEADCDVDSAFYIVFVLRVVTLVAAIKLFSPLKVSSTALQSLITTFRLKHLANVTVFYFAVLYIYALIGVHVIGSLEYHCVSDELSDNSSLRLCWDIHDKEDIDCNYSCVTPSALSLPHLHCDPRMENSYRCPNGTSCREIKISRNLGYYGQYNNLGKRIYSYVGI